MIFPPPPGLSLLAYEHGSISKQECYHLIKLWNEKHTHKSEMPLSEPPKEDGDG